MRKSEILLILCFILVLNSCLEISIVPDSSARVKSSITPSLTIQATSITPSASLTPSLTSTLTPFTSIPSILSTPSLPSEERFEDNCLEVVKGIPGDAEVSEGNIVVQANNSKITQLWNLRTGDLKQLTVRGDGFKVSPDGKWLAYWEGSDNPNVPYGWLKISDNLGTQKLEIPWEDKWGGLWRGIAGWLDSQHIILRNQLIEGDAYSPSLAKIIINPFTKQQDDLITNFSDLFFLYPYPDWQGWGIAIYDPSLSIVVYEGNYELVVLDVKTNQVITRIDHIRPFDSYPLWSPNGKEFVISNPSFVDNTSMNDELFRINKDGQVEQLTNLRQYYDDALIQSYQWSPDGKYIALWLFADKQSSQGNLAVLDTSTLQVSNYCFSDTKLGYTNSLLIWSHDSRQIIIESINVNNSKTSNLILVDIYAGWAAQIAENLTVKGWMSPPTQKQP